MKASPLVALIGLCWCCGCVGLVKPLGSVELNDYPQAARLPLKYYVHFPSAALDNVRNTATSRLPFNFELGGLFRYNVSAALDKVFLSRTASSEAADVRIEANLASFLAYGPAGNGVASMEMGIHYRLFAKDGHEVGQFVSVTTHESDPDAGSIAEGVKIALATCLDDLNQKILRKRNLMISLRQESK